MKKIIFGCVITLVSLLYACKKDFVVKDITKSTIVVNSPANNAVTTSNLVTFWWEELDGAEKYNLQIVQPAFSSITKLVLDTNITLTKFNLTLNPGTYEWRIRGVNNGGFSPYQTYSLKIDTTSNLTSLLVSTILPVNNYLTGNKTVAFSWNTLNAATQYEIVLLNSTNGVIKDTVTANTTYTYSFPSLSSNYSWKVRAQNNSSISQYFTPLTFTIDLTPPSVSTPTSPTHGSVITNTKSLSWTRIGAPDARYDSVYVATDSAFTNIISLNKTYQQSILISALNNSPASNSTYYWWRLRSVDSVGNRSVFSSQLKFKLIP